MLIYAVERFSIPPEPGRVVAAVEACAGQLGLHKFSVQHKPDRTHWHWKRPGTSGTCEVTWKADENLILVSVHQNRVGTNEWAKKTAPKFARQLAQELDAKTARRATV